jgi:hypothetical protein
VKRSAVRFVSAPLDDVSQLPTSSQAITHLELPLLLDSPQSHLDISQHEQGIAGVAIIFTQT